MMRCTATSSALGSVSPDPISYNHPLLSVFVPRYRTNMKCWKQANKFVRSVVIMEVNHSYTCTVMLVVLGSVAPDPISYMPSTIRGGSGENYCIRIDGILFPSGNNLLKLNSLASNIIAGE